MPIKTYSFTEMENKIKTETDPKRKSNLKQLLEEMAEIYPDENEIPDNPLELFTTPKQWKSEELKNKIVMGIYGKSFAGKTFQALSSSHLTQKHIRNDFKQLPEAQQHGFIKFLERYIPFTPVWVIGTEESTLECLRAIDNEEYFSHANINYVEILQKGTSELSLVDHIRTYKKFLIVILALRNLLRGTVILDSTSTVLTSQHEVIRRVMMKIPKLKREQGVPTRYWFWRNMEREGIMFYARILPINFIFTAKMITQHIEDGADIEKIKWWEETDRHLSSVIVRNEQIKTSNDFRSTLEKCRPNSHLANKTFTNFTLPKFMFSLYKSSLKKPIKNKQKQKKQV